MVHLLLLALDQHRNLLYKKLRGMMHQLQSDAVVVFARLPVPGQVKTRLAATVGNEAAALFYQRCAERVIAALGRYSSSLQQDRLHVLGPAWLAGGFLTLLPIPIAAHSTMSWLMCSNVHILHHAGLQTLRSIYSTHRERRTRRWRHG